MKAILYSLLSAGACLAPTVLFSQVEPGTYEGQTFDSLSISSPDQSSEWIFNSCTFTNSSGISLTPKDGVEYSVKIYESALVLSSLKLNNSAANSSSYFELSGSADRRSSLAVAANWQFGTWLSGLENSQVSQTIHIAGYTDVNVNTVNLSSDGGQLSGAALVEISGASNTFNVSGNTYIGSNNQAQGANYSATLKISGVDGVKSVATFGGELNIYSSNNISSSFHMAGNSEASISGVFRLFSASGTSTFKMNGSGNKLTFTGAQFAVGETSTGGVSNFEISGSNNELSVTSQYDVWFGNVNQGKTNVTISGSGHTINFNKNIAFRAGYEDGTTLLFAADENGVSTIYAAGVRTFENTKLVLDFTNFVGDGSGVYEIALISTTNDWSALAQQFVGSSEGGESSANVIMGANGESWEIAYSGSGELIFSYTYAVPEPSTFAAIAGALALAFAAYRRKRLS